MAEKRPRGTLALPEYSLGVKKVRGRYDALIVPPLFIITIFCFAFILLQPHKVSAPSATASKQVQPAVPISAAALPPLPMAASNSLAQLSPEPATDPSVVNDGMQTMSVPLSSSSSTTSLQPTKTNSDGSSTTLITSVLKTATSLPTTTKK